MKEYIVPGLAVLGGFALALYAFKWSQNYMKAATDKGPAAMSGSRRMGAVIRPESDWEKSKMSQGILMTLG